MATTEAKPSFRRSSGASRATTGSRRDKFRSSSIGSFIARLLPSRRQERAHALRADYRQSGSQDAADLVFGLTTPELARVYGIVDDAKTTQWDTQTIRKKDGKIIGLSHSKHATGAGYGAAKPVAGHQKSSASRDMFTALKLSTDANYIAPKHVETLAPISDTPPVLDMPNLYNNELLFSPRKFLSDEMELMRQQEIERARKEQRRILRESGDYLGVQGANPRTGDWDNSNPTTSTESHGSDLAKLVVSKHAREFMDQKNKLAEEKRKLDVAVERYQRVRAKEAIKLERKKKLDEQKRAMAMKMRRQRYGKWTTNESGWSIVLEPGLSPVAGSPSAESPQELAGPMPCAAKSAPYTNNNIDVVKSFTMKHTQLSNQEDPFVSSQPTPNHLTYELPAISTRQIMRREVPQSPSRRQRLETSTETIIRTYIPKGHPNVTEKVRNNLSKGHTIVTEQARNNKFHGLGHPAPERAREQNPTTPLRLQHTSTQYEAHHTDSSYITNPDLNVVCTASLSQEQQSAFLEEVTMSLIRSDLFQQEVKQGQQSPLLQKVAMSMKKNDPFQNGATVTSYQWVSTKQASILQQLVLNRCIQGSTQIQECHGTIFPKELLLGSPTRPIARIQWNYPTMNDHTLQVIIPKRCQSLGFAARIQHRLGPNRSMVRILCSNLPKQLSTTTPYQILPDRSIGKISAPVAPDRPPTTINYQIVRNQPMIGIPHPIMAKKQLTTIPYQIVRNRSIANLSRPTIPNQSFSTIPYQIVESQSLATFSAQAIPEHINYQNILSQPFAWMLGRILPENPVTMVLDQAVPGQPTIQPSCTTFTTTITGSDHLQVLPNREGNEDTEDHSTMAFDRFLFCLFVFSFLAFFDRLGMGLFEKQGYRRLHNS